MDSSEMESDVQILGLGEDDHGNQNISYEVDPVLGTKRLHLDSESSVDIEVGSFGGFMMDKRIKLENNSEDETEGSSGLMRTGCEELGDDTGIMLGSTPPEVMASSSSDLVFNNETENSDDDACILIHHMDIKEPLANLKKALEETHSINLDGYEFYLQDTTLDDPGFQCMCPTVPVPQDLNEVLTIELASDSFWLENHKNLVEQCVQGCGTVQVNLELKVAEDGTKKINIIDVLKPSDSYLLATGNPAFSPDVPEETNQTPMSEEEGPSDKNLIRWVVDNNFKASQHRLKIPEDPMKWDVPHVRHWLLWAVRQFNLTGINLADWKISGAMLCNLTLDDFKARVPYDPADIFWTHLELLRRCKFVAVMQNPKEVITNEDSPKEKENETDKNIMRGREKKTKTSVKTAVIMEQNASPTNSGWALRSGSGNNGQVQLWQFLLDLLTDKNHREVIQWLGAEGEFKLMNPERVAYLWGLRKNKPSMNYEKLSRALRYYYDGDMIAKVHGKRFVYKFVCDLKQLLGYSAFELNRLVIEAEMRSQNAAHDPLQHSIFGNRNVSQL